MYRARRGTPRGSRVSRRTNYLVGARGRTTCHPLPAKLIQGGRRKGTGSKKKGVLALTRAYPPDRLVVKGNDTGERGKGDPILDETTGPSIDRRLCRSKRKKTRSGSVRGKKKKKKLILLASPRKSSTDRHCDKGSGEAIGRENMRKCRMRRVLWKGCAQSQSGGPSGTRVEVSPPDLQVFKKEVKKQHLKRGAWEKTHERARMKRRTF